MTSLELLMAFLNQAYDEIGLCWECTEHSCNEDEKFLCITIGGRYGLDFIFDESGNLKE